MKSASVAIIIVSFNTSEMTLRCVETIPQAVGDLEAEVIVVDNASTDDSVERLQREQPNVLIIENKKNVGYAGAVNQGVRASRSTWAVISNSDVEFHPGSIKTLADYLAANDEVGIVGPQFVYPDGSWQRSYGEMPGLAEEVNNLVGLTSFRHLIRGLTWPRYTVDRHPKEVKYISGAVIVTRRTAFEEVNGWDEGFFLYAEEADFCYRVNRQGWKIVFHPGVTVMHVGGGTTKAVEPVSGTYLKRLITSKAVLAQKRYSRLQMTLYFVLGEAHALKMAAIYYCLSLVTGSKRRKSMKAMLTTFLRTAQAWRENRREFLFSSTLAGRELA